MKVASAFRKYFKTSFYESQLVSENNWALYLRPDNAMKEAYGLEREVLCVVSEYEELEVRTLDSANDLIDRAGLRLEQDVFFLISSAKNAERLCDQYSKQHGRRIVSPHGLISNQRTRPILMNCLDHSFLIGNYSIKQLQSLSMVNSLVEIMSSLKS